MPWIAAALKFFFETPTVFTTTAIASQKTLLRHALSHPSSFVYIILHMFFPEAPYKKFTPRHCVTIYGWFSEKMTCTPTSVPHLTNIFTTFKQRKLDMDEIRKKVLSANVWNNIFIHRIRHVPSRRKHISQGKKVVLDLCNRILYPDSKYYHLNTAEAYHVFPTDATTPQLHLLLADLPDTPSDSDIREMFHQTERPELTMEDWYVGAVVYNLFSADPFLAELLDTCGGHLDVNINNRKKITRGDDRNDPDGIMVGFGPQRPSQDGEVDNWGNFKSSVDEDNKYQLEKECDETFDAFLNVPPFFNSLIL
jgi:hypothetical protein